MIRPSQQWAHLIDITNACSLHCSNCTRLLDHAKTRYFMSLECFEAAVIALSDFVTDSEPDPLGRRKVVGIMGGEPLLHPQFPELVDIMIRHIPQVYHRGLWTSKDWKTGSHPKWGAYRPQVERLIGPNPKSGGTKGPSERHSGGFLNWNMHLPSMRVSHQPVLVASKDSVPDEKRRWQLIEACWVQNTWSSAVTPKGFFFCEVAAHFDMIFDGPGGFPLEPGAWRGDLSFVTDDRGVRRPVGKFASQVEQWCERCGACVPMAGRLDSQNVDDISVSNLQPLIQVHSPRVKRGDIALHTFERPFVEQRAGWQPRRYIKGQKPKDQSDAARAER